VEVKVMLARVGNSTDVVAGQMRVFDVAGTRVNVASADGHLYAFDDTCTHTGCSLARGTLDGMTVTCSADRPADLCVPEWCKSRARIYLPKREPRPVLRRGFTATC
jgi:hypothetical protein